MSDENEQLGGIICTIGVAISTTATTALTKLHPEDAIKAIAGGLGAAAVNYAPGEFAELANKIQPCGRHGCQCHEAMKDLARLLERLNGDGRKEMAAHSHAPGNN